MPLHLPFGQLFTAKRNRVEFVCDFPEGDDAEVISSLQMHPQGWVAVTRNLSADEESEVKDLGPIQGVPSARGLGWVDLDFECSNVCSILLGLMGI